MCSIRPNYLWLFKMIILPVWKPRSGIVLCNLVKVDGQALCSQWSSNCHRIWCKASKMTLSFFFNLRREYTNKRTFHSLKRFILQNTMKTVHCKATRAILKHCGKRADGSLTVDLVSVCFVVSLWSSFIKWASFILLKTKLDLPFLYMSPSQTWPQHFSPTF